MSAAGAPVSTPGGRRRVSPYARRLARERGVPLAALGGSGPGGRIVAADVLTYRPAAPQVPANSDASPAAPVPVLQPILPEIIAATADITALTGLLATFTEVGRDVTREDVVLRAAALALADDPEGPQGAVSLETESGAVMLAGAEKLAVTGVRAIREGGAGCDGPKAALSLRIHGRPGIRGVFLPLRPGVPLRLAVAFGETVVECLLVYDPEQIRGRRAEALLAAFRDRLETPLTLFV